MPEPETQIHRIALNGVLSALEGRIRLAEVPPGVLSEFRDLVSLAEALDSKTKEQLKLADLEKRLIALENELAYRQSQKAAIMEAKGRRLG